MRKEDAFEGQVLCSGRVAGPVTEEQGVRSVDPNLMMPVSSPRGLGPGLRFETHLLGDNTNTEAFLSLALLHPQPEIVQAGWLCQELKQTSPNAMLNSNPCA